MGGGLASGSSIASGGGVTIQIIELLAKVSFKEKIIVNL